MAKSLYIASINARSGKSIIILGIMELLLRYLRKVGFFRPIIYSGGAMEKDHDINLVLSHYYLGLGYEESYGVTHHHAQKLINSGKQAQLMEIILNKYKQLEEKCDFVLCEGTDVIAGHGAFGLDMNAAIAANLGCPVFVTANGCKSSVEDIAGLCHLAIETLEDRGGDIMGFFVNRADKAAKDDILAVLKENINIPDGLFYVIVEEKSLFSPTMSDVKEWLDAKVLYGAKDLDNRIDGYVIAAMQVSNFLNYIKQGNLILTPADRPDVILGAMASRISTAYPDISGIVLTGGQAPPESIRRLVEGWEGIPVPILLAENSTFPTVSSLYELRGKIDPDNPGKIASALGVFESNIDTDELKNKLVSRKSVKITPQMFEYNLIQKARKRRQHIVLPEGTGERILRAVDILLRRDVCEITLLGKEDEIKKRISSLGLDLPGVNIVQPDKSFLFDEYVEIYCELRKNKGVNRDMARDAMMDETYFGTMMTHMGDADGMVSGSVHTTAQTIRPAFQIIRTRPGSPVVSSVFLMCLKDRVLVFGDCAVNPNPTAEQLSAIAAASAQTARVFGIEPRVAMLSYATGGSGSGQDVEKVILATRLAREKYPDLLLEGPLQYDAAIDPIVARTKLPKSRVAGRATVFVFPDLNTGNNTYKAVQRASEHSLAIGPVLQGLNKPVNDLSRGCTIPDIVNTVAITAIQAHAGKQRVKENKGKKEI